MDRDIICVLNYHVKLLRQKNVISPFFKLFIIPLFSFQTFGPIRSFDSRLGKATGLSTACRLKSFLHTQMYELSVHGNLIGTYNKYKEAFNNFEGRENNM